MGNPIVHFQHADFNDPVYCDQLLQRTQTDHRFHKDFPDLDADFFKRNWLPAYSKRKGTFYPRQKLHHRM